MANNYEDGILGYDCDHQGIEEFRILRAIWANDVDIEELEDADPRQYCAVIAEDGKAYAISVWDRDYKKLIREREHIPEDEDIPIIVKPISAMINYEVAFGNGGETQLFYDDYAREKLKETLNNILKSNPIFKEVEDINNEIKVLRSQGKSVKKISDGYHTFEDYTDDRNLYFMALCEAYYDISWKSRKHFDEENDPMFDGDFIAGINTPSGVITQHIKMKYWDELNVREIDNSPKYDGYTREDVRERVKSLVKLREQNKQ